MNKLFLSLALIFLSISCSNPTGKKENLLPPPGSITEELEAQKDLAKIDFSKTIHEFGDVQHGEVLEYTFVFKNTGKSDLVIYSALAGCGCTVPEFDKNPIAPGESGKVKIVFNTRGFRGIQNKAITIYSNAANSTVSLFVTAHIHV
jgi:hypothetical protein